MTLERVTKALFGGMTLVMSGYILALHLTSGEPLQVPILLLCGALLGAAAVCLRAGLTATSDTRTDLPLSPTGGEMAAWRLLTLKKHPNTSGAIRSRLTGNYAGYRP